MTEITYREATRDDAKGISSLILESQEEFSFHEYTEEGKKVMLQLCGAEAIQSYVEHGDIYWVALHENQLIGVAGVRDKNHPTISWLRVGIVGESRAAFGNWLVKSVFAEAMTVLSN